MFLFSFSVSPFSPSFPLSIATSQELQRTGVARPFSNSDRPANTFSPQVLPEQALGCLSLWLGNLAKNQTNKKTSENDAKVGNTQALWFKHIGWNPSSKNPSLCFYFLVCKMGAVITPGS